MHGVNVTSWRRMKNEMEGVKPVEGHGRHGEYAMSTVSWGRGSMRSAQVEFAVRNVVEHRM